ncbi:MAG TPA: hypothetical protein V6C65_15030 [Allocoleopsis sp.]
MTLRERQTYSPLPITWLPGIPGAIAPAEPAQTAASKPEIRILNKLLLFMAGVGLIGFACYWSGRNAVQPMLDQTQAELKLQRVKAKELNDELYDAQLALQANQQAATQLAAVRAIVCPETQGK